MNRTSAAKQNKVALALLLLVVIMAGILLSVPAYRFTSTVYSQKSPNTFVGDEKYLAVKAEVETLADEYRTQGMEVTVDESVTERTNSKGEKTSLVAFTISEKFTKNGWSFLTAGINSSCALAAILICLLGALACAALGCRGSLDTTYKFLDSGSARLRNASCWLLLIAILLVPVFFMMSTYTLSRRVGLYTAGIVTEGKEALFQTLDKFLFAGMAGENVDVALKNLKFSNTGVLWALLPVAFVGLVAAIQLRFGTVKHTLLRGLLYAFVIGMCLFILYPYYVMLITAFRTNAETNDMYFQHLFPTEWKWENLSHIVSRGVPRYLLNSAMIAGGATLIALICGIPAAYAMSRMKFKGKKIFLGFVIMSQMFSPVVLLIGISQLMSTLHLNDNILGLMLINAAFNQAFAIWLLRGTFVAISPEMEQAARIDGCSVLGSLWHVLLPMAAPGIVTTLIFVFINAWNEYTISTVLISTASNRPITVGITQFSSFNMIEWQYLFAASLLATIPVVIMFMFIEKHLTSGLTAGGVKG